MAKRDTSTEKKPNILVIWGDDIGQSNLSRYTKGVMGYRTPNIDRIANEGMIFTDYYGEQSCTAGRSAFITGQSVFRTGLSKVGMPGATLGMQAEDPSIADFLSRSVMPLVSSAKTTSATGTSTCRRCTASTSSSATSTTSMPRKSLSCATTRRKKSSPTSGRGSARAVCCIAGRGQRQARSRTPGPLTKKRMETIDEEVLCMREGFIDQTPTAYGKPFFVWFNTTHMHFRTHTKPEKPRSVGALAVRIPRRHDRS